MTEHYLFVMMLKAINAMYCVWSDWSLKRNAYEGPRSVINKYSIICLLTIYCFQLLMQFCTSCVTAIMGAVKFVPLIASTIANHFVGFFFYGVAFSNPWFEAMCEDKGGRDWYGAHDF